MKYMLALWHHTHPEEPVKLYSELTDDRWEVRKVYIFPDGHYEWADENHDTGPTFLSEKPIPPLNEINAQVEFEAVEISSEEFSAIWDLALNSN
jgi:hypothetical protein